MENLHKLARLIKSRNEIDNEIAGIIGRPAEKGHIGEYIASRIFHISLEPSGSQKGIDGRFADGPLAGKTVNIKWYTKLEGVLDMNPQALPHYYLVLTGPKAPAVSSQDSSRPMVIESVYLFDAGTIVSSLQARGVKIGVATSVARYLWEEAEIYPVQRSPLLLLSGEQRAILALFQ